MKIYTTHTFYGEYGDASREAMRQFEAAMEADGWRLVWANIAMDHQFVVYWKTLSVGD